MAFIDYTSGYLLFFKFRAKNNKHTYVIVSIWNIV